MEEEKRDLKIKRKVDRLLFSDFLRRHRTKIILILFCIAMSVVIFKACTGWRIVYAPELEPDWNSVSAVASLIGAVRTVAAVWFAVRVADKQNQIALFEKRCTAYTKLNNLHMFAEHIDKEMFDEDRSASDDENCVVVTFTQETDENEPERKSKPAPQKGAHIVFEEKAKIALFCAEFEASFGYQPMATGNEVNLNNLSQVRAILDSYKNDILMSSFLYSLSLKEQKRMEIEINNFLIPLRNFACQIAMYTCEGKSKYDDTNRKNFIKGINEFHDKYWLLFESALKI